MTQIVIFIALAAMALVGLDLMLRAERHVDLSAERVERDRALPLEALSHRLLPRLETASGYRLIGLAIILVAAAFAAAILTGYLGE